MNIRILKYGEIPLEIELNLIELNAYIKEFIEQKFNFIAQQSVMELNAVELNI